MQSVFFLSEIYPGVAVMSMPSPWLLGGWIVLLVMLMLAGLLLNLLGLAGNWLILAASLAHFFLVDQELRPAYQPGLLWMLLGLALLGEGMEFLSGLMGAGKAGGSRRAMLLSMLGGMAGSMLGFGIGNAVVFLAGGIVGMVLFGGLGALAGAMLGELWKGSDTRKQVAVGKAAFTGRVLGTFAKSMAGTLMFLCAVWGLFV